MWRLWQAAQTQWRYSPAGATGLDYPAVALVAQSLRIDFPRSPRVFRLLQHLEHETLARLTQSARHA